MIWIQLAIVVVSAVLAWLLAPGANNNNKRKTKAAALEDFDAPIAKEGIPVPVVFGKVWIKAPNVVWYGDLQARKRKRDGVKGYYKYYLGMHMVACHGPVTSVTRIKVGDEMPWTGSVGGTSQIFIDDKELWGGVTKGGGIQGYVSFLFGSPSQAQNNYLVGVLGGGVPAFRGVLSFVLEQVYLSANNPTLHPWAFEVIDHTGAGSAAWYTVKRSLADSTLNAMHILYYSLTNEVWGMGYPTSRMDDTQMQATADTLHAEGFGLSLKWAQEESIENFVQLILDHIGGVLVVNTSTGKFQIKLIRADYDVDSLPLFDETNIATYDSFQRTAWGETTNEIIVNYTDADTGDTRTLPGVQDYGNVHAQGGLISSTRDYQGIVSSSLAARVAMRDLKAVASPLSRIEITVNREAWSLTEGDVFRYTNAKLGIYAMPCRVGSVSLGELTDGKIRIVAVEDIFGLPDTTYVGQQESLWTDPINEPADATNPQLLETPYWMLVQYLGINSLPSDWQITYLTTIASAPTPDAADFDLYSKTGANDYAAGTSGGLGSVVSVAADIVPEIYTSVGIANVKDITFLEEGDVCLLGDEIVQIDHIAVGHVSVDIFRGLMDTTPGYYPAGTLLQSLWGYEAFSTAAYAVGDQISAKLLTSTSKGRLDIDVASVSSIAAVGRQGRPLPPGQFEINSVSYPASFSGEPTITWVERNRLVQTTLPLVTQGADQYSAEPGVDYTLRIYGEADDLLRTEPGLTGNAYTYTNINEVADSGLPSGQSLTLINPGAETGDMTGWTVEDGAAYVTSSAASGFVLAHTGTYFLAGGDVSATGGFARIANDAVDLVAQGITIGDIDAGNAWINIDYWQASNVAADKGRGGVKFLDSGSVMISEDFDDWLAVSPSRVWVNRTNTFRIPVNTRYLQVVCEMELIDGTYVSVYLDDFILRYEVCPTVSVPITNPGAADGTTTGWNNETGSLGVETGTGADGNPNYFFGGANALTVAVSDRLDLISAGAVGADIDAGKALVDIQYFVSSYSQSDKGKLGLRFYDDADTLISEDVDLYSAASVYPTWDEKRRYKQLPGTTRYIRIVMYMQRIAGTDNDAYFDEFSMVYRTCSGGRLNSQLRFVLESDRDTVTSFQAQDWTSQRV